MCSVSWITLIADKYMCTDTKSKTKKRRKCENTNNNTAGIHYIRYIASMHGMRSKKVVNSN